MSRVRSYRLRRQLQLRGAASPPFLVEFVGPPGAGKTTTVGWLGGLTRQHWLFREHLALADPAPSPADTEATYNGLFRQRLARHTRDHRSMKFARYLLRIIDEDRSALNARLGAGVILDESIFQVFKTEILDLPAEAFAPLARNRVLVALMPERADTVVRRLTARHRALGTAPPQNGEDLHGSVERSAENCREVVERSRGSGVPVLDLIAEDGAEQNARAVEAFLTRLGSSVSPVGSPLADVPLVRPVPLPLSEGGSDPSTWPKPMAGPGAPVS